MNNDDPKARVYAASVQARRAELERLLQDDSALNQSHAVETEPKRWPLGHMVFVLFES